MPQMGVSVVDGTVIEWRKRPGDWIEADEPICDVSTDKVDVEVPSPATGRVAELVVEPGVSVAVGTVLARIDSAAKPGEAHVDEGPARPAPVITPVVRRIAEHEGVDLAQVQGTGRRGRVTKKDVLAFLAGEEKSAPEPRPLHTESPYRDEAATTAVEGLSPMRRSIAEHMVRSLHTAAHCTTISEADFSAVDARRDGRSYLPFVAGAVVEAL